MQQPTTSPTPAFLDGTVKRMFIDGKHAASVSGRTF
ncbi:MAG: hypothetical protein JWQ03_533, partial [Variovorax sp.]|nr:hypothetical protein [Variovorax sp.]